MLIRLLLGKRPFTIVPSPRRRAFSAAAAAAATSSSSLVDFFHGYGVEEEQTNMMVDKYPKLRSVNVETILRPKLDFLRSAGVAGADIPPFLVANPTILAMFGSAFLEKVELYKQLGFSEEQVAEVIRKRPFTMTMPDESLRKALGFFMEKVGWGTDSIVLNPDLLCLNIDRRVMPRCAVLNMLMSRDLLKKDVDRLVPITLRFRHKHFFKRFVRRYRKQAPDGKKAFKRRIPFEGWEWLKEDA